MVHVLIEGNIQENAVVMVPHHENSPAKHKTDFIVKMRHWVPLHQFPGHYPLLNIGYMLEEQTSHPHCSLDFALAALILFMQLHFKKYNLSFTIFLEK